MKITKREMVYDLTHSKAWDGEKREKELLKWSWQELYDCWQLLEDAEEALNAYLLGETPTIDYWFD